MNNKRKIYFLICGLLLLLSTKIVFANASLVINEIYNYSSKPLNVVVQDNNGTSKTYKVPKGQDSIDNPGCMVTNKDYDLGGTDDTGIYGVSGGKIDHFKVKWYAASAGVSAHYSINDTTTGKWWNANVYFFLQKAYINIGIDVNGQPFFSNEDKC